ncbi:cylE protein [Streptococcus sp. 45]|uniref:cylE protein n=1 Tax=Streptococcus sp. 45 TaxID=1855326 RepID=UPI000B836846|nr:cylE protein [Streptococcus sp. 45]
MMEENQLEVFRAQFDDYPEIINLFNKNKVYQFPDGKPLSVEDFDLTMKVKEVEPFFLLRQQKKLIGTSAFFKFITHECLDVDSSFSGFLLIDSENRGGQAISYLYRTILERIAQLGFSNLFTEISKYNKPSLSLSRLNGFREYSQTYEDILHCRSLRSNLPKVIKTFCLSDYYGKEYDLSTFEILEEIEDSTRKETFIRTQISKEELSFKVQDEATLPYFLKMALFQLEIVQESGRFYLQVDSLSEDIEKIQVKIGKRLARLDRKHKRLSLGLASRYFVQANIVTKQGTIAVQLERCRNQSVGKNHLLKQNFSGYRLKVSHEGSLLFCKGERVVFEDTFIMFSKPLTLTFKVKEKPNHLEIIWSYKKARIKKTISFSEDTMICRYDCNATAKDMMPQLIKQGFRIFNQEHLIKEQTTYKANRPGYYPQEHDDFLRAEAFVGESFDYEIPSEDCHVHYSPLGKASNQMQFRPLSICSPDEFAGSSYQITFSDLTLPKTQPFFDKLGYQPSSKNLLKYISQLTLEQEHGYGTKRFLKNRKSYATSRLVLAHNQLVIPYKAIPKDCDYASLSFTFKIKGNLKALRFHESIPYQNKSHILESKQQLVVYDEKQDRYICFACKDGVFYSYKENNSLKIRCVFDTSLTHAVNVRITEYKRS